MATNKPDFLTKTEIKSYLEKILLSQNIIKVQIMEYQQTNNSDGYVGDIYFIKATVTTKRNEQLPYNLVLKSSKSSKAYRLHIPVQQLFENEIYFYEQIYPAYREFQINRLSKNVWSTVPEFYGKCIEENKEIFLLEDLKAKRYEMWKREEPLTTDHLIMVLKEFAKFHAISVAMQDQNADQFRRLFANFGDVVEVLMATGMVKMFEESIQLSYNELQGVVKDETLNKWLGLKSQLEFILIQMRKDENCVKVLTHGDSWLNNFMFTHDELDDTLPTSVRILDWPHISLISPILDISHFLFSCISKTDLMYFSYLLEFYYQSFTKNLNELGSDPNKLYTKEQFFNDWNKFARYGLVISTITIKMAFCQNDKDIDLVSSAETGQDIAHSFQFELKDKIGYRTRMGNIVKFAVEKNLV